jgi:hypothetical protein
MFAAKTGLGLGKKGGLVLQNVCKLPFDRPVEPDPVLEAWTDRPEEISMEPSASTRASRKGLG